LQLHVRTFVPQSKRQRDLHMLGLAIKAERKIKAGQMNAESSTAEDQPLLVCHSSTAGFRGPGT